MATLTRRKKKVDKIVIDFTPLATRVFMRRRTHAYLHLRDEFGEGVFLTMDSEVSPKGISVFRCPMVIPEGAKHHTYRVQFKRDDFEDLEPFEYDFQKAVVKFHSSLLGRTAGAEREMRAILGLEKLQESVTDEDLAVERPEPKRARKGPSEAKAKPQGASGSGYTLQELCTELGIEPTEARKYLRQQKAEKPGGRWEWPSAEAAASIRSMLETMPKE